MSQFETKIRIEKKPTVSTTLLHVLAMFSESKGLDFKKICEAAGESTSVLTEKDDRIAAERFLNIWNKVEQASGDKNFGLHFGKNLAANYLRGNILFNMMANCSTIGDAIEVFCKYHLLMEDAILPKMALKEDAVLLWWELFIPGVRIPRQHAESLMCAVTEILRAVSENQINPVEVRFSHSSPDDTTEHQAIFKTRLVFDQSKTGLEISRTDFDRPIFLASHELLETLEALARKRLHKLVFPGSSSDKVIQEIYALLSSGKVPDVETVASNLALSSRNLQMKLQKEKTTFKKLLDQLRKDTALACLKDPDMSICEIALLLGFSEQSAFNHAFKRWTGTSPGIYKRKI